ncbi:hypothetical protein DHEL01_v209139 [Diaporthe helianthi]|uniref:Uncharacterized protein n=1 Tax=Diaporthe helianthi TaxID=158607 RepID=A0A2P5HQF9_DIAHE|nr:hypothetical protein DHEL01_v209139 [Diaporthe helianthi]
MSNPYERFQIGDEVVNRNSGVKGIVTKRIWLPIVKSHAYEYRCEFVADELNGSQTVWMKVRSPYVMTVSEFDLDEARNY